MSLVISSKAGTLTMLRERLQSARIPPLVYFSVANWHDDRTACLARVRSSLDDGPWIVRSSGQHEDNANQSNAGKFLSLPNVTSESLEGAIENVILAYGEYCKDDEVLIQPMLETVVLSGVAFSHDPNTCSPYRVVNWSEGGDTEVVTRGLGGRTWQQAAKSSVEIPAKLVGIVALLEELLTLFGNAPIDCEFGVTRDQSGDVLWLLQVRLLVLSRTPETEEKQSERLCRIQNKVVQGMLPHPFLMGQRTVYGVMPDWNPAEIIGIRPRPLALSLYRELVTDSIWAYQRHHYGYRNLRSFPLMLHFFGMPYIDVRLSFNSFIPADLAKEVSTRLVDYYIERLLSEPSLHDKVEFDIVLSCYTLDLSDRLSHLAEINHKHL